MSKSAKTPAAVPLEIQSAQTMKEEKTVINGDEEDYAVSKQKLKETIINGKTPNPEDSTEPEQIARPAMDEPTTSKTTAIVLVLALGFHAIFEGLAFGLMTELDSAWQLALGIVIHKAPAAVSLGGAFTRSGFGMKEIFFFITLFAVMSPIGVVIGIFLTETNLLIDSIFVALSGGTFIYVACSEILIAEFDRGGY